MRIALVDGSPISNVYPLPLLKLGAWQKAEGNTCKLFYDGKLPEAGEFDEIWVTTRFTYDVLFARKVIHEATKRAGRVWIGGISASLLPHYFKNLDADIHVGLLLEAERFSPDYSLLDEPPEYSITHTSRGCIRKCKFCMVPKLEPEFSHREDWERDLAPEATRVLFYDNNWLAKAPEDFAADIEKLRNLVAEKRITNIDFNQGLDARLLTDEIADMLEGLPISPVRFAFDGMQEDGHYQRAVGMMADRGFRKFMTYVLYNFTDTPQDFYYRLRESVRLSAERRIEVSSYPMRFQPILEADRGRAYVGKHWTKQKKKAFSAIRSRHSLFGQISFTSHGGILKPMEEFEYWFGKDAEEFVRLLSYPKIIELMKRRKGALRMMRAQAAREAEIEKSPGVV